MDFYTLHTAKTYGVLILTMLSTYLGMQLLFPNLFFTLELPFALIASAANVVLAWSYVKFFTGVQKIVQEANGHLQFINFTIYKLVVVLSTLSAAFISPLSIYFGGEVIEFAQSMYFGIFFITGVVSVMAAEALKKCKGVIASDAQIAAWSLRITGFLFSFAWFFGSAAPAMFTFTSLIAYFFMWRMISTKLKSARS